MNVEEYFATLPDDVEEINLSGKGLTYLPDLSRFTNLRILQVNFNNLTELPELPERLEELYCVENRLTQLPRFNEHLRQILCSRNQLTSLPKMNDKLQFIICNCNNLTSLPKLPVNLNVMSCENNQLTSLPELNEKLIELYCDNNPLPEIFHFEMPLVSYYNRNIINRYIRCKTKIMCLKYEKQFRNWLWDRIRRPRIEMMYHPDRLNELLSQMEDPYDDEERSKLLEQW